MRKNKILISVFLAVSLTLLGLGHAFAANLKGVDAKGQKVYLAEVPINNTVAFKTYLASPKSEVNKQQYLFARLKDAPKNLEYFHDGNWYSWVEAYRGGMWLMRNRYKKGQDTRLFLKKYVWRSEDTNKEHLVRYPDGSIQVGYFVLLNELDLLEETVKKS